MSKGRQVWLFLKLILCFCAVHTGAATFDEANKLYYEGKFAEAADMYEKLVHSGKVSPALYFNLGNARFKSGQIGQAIVAYRLAESYTPRDPDLRANLQFARNQTQGPSFSEKRWQRALGKLTVNEWTCLAFGSVWIWLILLTVRRWRPSWSRNLVGVLIVSTIASAIFCAGLGFALYETRVIQSAVVITPEAIVRYGPLDVSQVAFTLHDGSELRVLDRKDDWLRVTTGPRRAGWLHRDQVLFARR